MNDAHSGERLLVRDPDGTSVAREPTADECKSRDLVDSLNAEARANRRLDYEKDRRLAERAFALASQPDEQGQRYTHGMATALSLLAHRNCILGETSVALSQATQVLSLLGAAEPSVVLADTYDCIGWCHFCLGDYAEALDYLMRALQIADKIDDRSVQAYVLDSIGTVYTSSSHAATGLEMQERALTIHRELGDRMGEALTLNNMTYTYLDLGRSDDALASAESALRYAEEEQRQYLQMWALDTLADVYLNVGDADSAENLAKRALALARDHGSESDEANGMLALGKVAYLRERWDEALAATEDALRVIEKRGLTVQCYECHRLLSEIQERRKDFVAALEHYKLYHSQKQAKLNAETQSRLASLRVTHQVETARKDAEIHRLRSLALESEIEERRIAQAKLEVQTSLDPLTGLYNRYHLPVIVDGLRFDRTPHRTVSLMMFDIDRFKRINDTYGHLAGDNVLVSVARHLSANARESDVPCRYGGDEFLLLLVGMNAETAQTVAERIRGLISASPTRYGDAEIDFTISVGVTTAESDEPVEFRDLVARADRALYAAKQGGRNRVVVAERDADSGLLARAARDAGAVEG